MGLLTILVFLPLIALPVMFWLPSGGRNHRYLNLSVSLLQAILIAVLFLNHEGPVKEEAEWIRFSAGSQGILNIRYLLVLDHLNLLLILLAGIVMPLASLASWSIQQEEKAYHALFLLLNTTIYGCFLAGDFFLFFLFFEAMLLPMYFLIGRWGGARKAYASMKFFIYTLSGSAFILMVMLMTGFSFFDVKATAAEAGMPNAIESPSLALHLKTEIEQGRIPVERIVHSFAFPSAAVVGANGESMNLVPGSILAPGSFILGWDARILAFLLLLIGFAVKLPAVPLHTWLPDAHVEAPTPVSVILAALLLKIGAYGLIRAGFGYFPEAAVYWGSFMAGIGIVSIIYAALAALAQQDLKKMIAYSSVSHMGFVMLALGAGTATGINAALLQSFNHGILSAALFLIAGVLYDRTHSRLIDDYQGLWKKMPAYTFFVLLIFFASLGLPGLNAFVSEFLALSSAFESTHIQTGWAMLAVTGIILGAAYFLRAYQCMFMGAYALKQPEWDEVLKDLTPREWVMLSIPAVLALIGGIRPDWFLGLYAEETTQWFQMLSLSKP